LLPKLFSLGRINLRKRSQESFDLQDVCIFFQALARRIFGAAHAGVA